MLFLKLRTYSKVFIVMVMFAVLGIIICSGGLLEKLKRTFSVNQINSFYSLDSSLPHIGFRRSLASKLLKAAEDVRWGRHATAIFEIKSAAAVLDNRYYHSDTENPLAQPGWTRISSPESITLKKAKWNNRNKPHREPLSVASSTLNLTLSNPGWDSIHLPDIDARSIPSSGTSGDLGSIVTILLDECPGDQSIGWKAKTRRIVGQLRSQWLHVKIVIGVNRTNLGDLDDIHNGNDVIAIEVECDHWNRAPVWQFLSHVSSPYVLFLESTLAITPDLNITRLLRTSAAMRGVGVVGIAERGVDGGWTYTCSQLHHQNAHLSITEGYDYSQAACIFCDVTSQSFLAATSVLEIVHLEDSLPPPVRQLDFALQLHGINVMTVTCPDVMIHTTNKVLPPDEVLQSADASLCVTKEEKKQARDQHLGLKRLYRKLAQRYELNSISFHNRTFLEYSCQEIHYKCKANSRVREYLLPPCCLKLKNKLLRNYNILARDSLLPYKIEVGTLLGAVKFKNPIPWDFDDDVHYDNSNFKVFKQNKERLLQMGLVPSFQVIIRSKGEKHNYVIMHAKEGFSFDSWGVELVDDLSKTEHSNETFPNKIPCLQYGHYATPIHQFLEDSSNITNRIFQLRKDENKDLSYKRADLPKNDIIGRGLLRDKHYPPIPKAKCYLYTLVRIGNNWVPAPFNPGLHALKLFGNNLFKHEPHWRFRPNSGAVWPTCSTPGHPLCLNIHPSDGTTPFL